MTVKALPETRIIFFDIARRAGNCRQYRREIAISDVYTQKNRLLPDRGGKKYAEIKKG